MGQAPRKMAGPSGWSHRVATHLFVLIMACTLGTSPALFSQIEPTVTAKVTPEEIRPGGTATYTITVENGQPGTAPQLKLPEGVEALNDSPTYSTNIKIEKRTRTQVTEFSWDISSAKIGKYTIPPQEVSVGDKAYTSNDARLIVKNNPSTPSSPDDPLLTMELEKREIYFGESVPITVTLYLHRGVMLRRVGLIEIPKENFAIQRFPQHPEENVVNMAGQTYTALAFHSTLSALKEGKFKLGPATSEIIIDMPMERGMRGFFPAMEPRKMKPVSNDIEITVMPLPAEGKPSNFTGIVGDFDMTATADLHDLTVGDPISVEINVNGTGNFDALSPPALTTAQTWKTYPARRTNIPRADSIPEGGVHSATFNQVLIPRQMAEFIPPFEFSYFSPTKRKYLTARTQPIPLHMQPAANNSAAGKPSASSPTTSVESGPSEPDKVPTPAPKITDILTVLPDEVAWTTARTPLLHDRRFFVWNMAALSVVAVMLLGKLAVVLWRAHARSATTPLHALHRELRYAQVSRGRFYQMVAQYVQLSHHASQPLPEPVREVLVRNDQINYSPEHEKAGEPIPTDERAKVLAVLKS